MARFRKTAAQAPEATPMKMVFKGSQRFYKGFIGFIGFIGNNGKEHGNHYRGVVI